MLRLFIDFCDRRWFFFAFHLGILLALSGWEHAIPAFARVYGTSCSTCHLDFPSLKYFGKSFKDVGYKFPNDDELLLKNTAAMQGAPPNNEKAPKAGSQETRADDEQTGD